MPASPWHRDIDMDMDMDMGNRATLNGNANNCNCMWVRLDCGSKCAGKSLFGCRDRTSELARKRGSEEASHCPAARRIQSVLLQAVQIPGGHKLP